MAFVKVDQTMDVDVAQAVAIGQKERVIVRQVAIDALQTASSHRIQAGFGERDSEVLLLVSAHELDVRLASQGDAEVIVHGFVIQESSP